MISRRNSSGFFISLSANSAPISRPSCVPDYEKLYEVKDEFEAANLAGHLGQSILLTTGSKTLATFVHDKALEEKEIWARVLPVSSVLKMCEDLGLKAKNILAIQGPFSYEMNLAMINDYRVDVMVTKNSVFFIKSIVFLHKSNTSCFVEKTGTFFKFAFGLSITITDIPAFIAAFNLVSLPPTNPLFLVTITSTR